MNKICTSQEQSQKLIELGIDIETSDMHYIEDSSDNPYCELYASKLNEEARKHYNTHYIPAWSLSALMELIPDIIEDYVLRMDKIDGEYYIWYDKIGEGWSDTIAHPSSKNFIDTAFEMIVWLKENEKI